MLVWQRMGSGMQETAGLGFGMNPFSQEQKACLSSAWHRALGPQVATEQGSTHWLAMQDCDEGQSVCSL